MSKIPFTKMHGLGNDFMVINNLDRSIKLEKARIAELGDRRTGVGFDQMLVIEPATVNEAEFDYRIYNTDGSEVEHCGNGARCFARYVHEKGLTRSQSIPVNTAGGMITLRLLDDDQVCVEMGVPVFAPASIPFIADTEKDFYELRVEGHNIEPQALQVGSTAIGNPHVLLQVDDIDTAPVETLGPLIESHERFPNRVNVGFMQIVDTSNILLRVYERGVGETLACGSGACAAVAIGHKQGLLDKVVNVTLPGGSLHVQWKDFRSSIEMTGACSTVYEGQTIM